MASAGAVQIETIRERQDSARIFCHTVAMKRSVRSAAAIVATGLVLVACGTADDATPAAQSVADTAAPQADADATPDAGSTTDTTAAPPADAGTDAGEPVADDAAATSDAPAAEDVAPADAPVSAEPAVAVIGGRAFAAELSAESDFGENLLPDLLVDDIRSGEKVNFRNIFPAERPVLIWAWAPH